MLRVCGMNPVTRILYLSGILDHPGIQYEPTFIAGTGHPDGEAVVGCGLVGGPGRHGFVQYSGLFQVLGLLMNCDNKLE